MKTSTLDNQPIGQSLKEIQSQSLQEILNLDKGQYMLCNYYLDKCVAYLLLDGFQQKNTFVSPDITYQRTQLFNELGILEEYDKLFEALILILLDAKILRGDINEFITTSLVNDSLVLAEIVTIKETKGTSLTTNEMEWNLIKNTIKVVLVSMESLFDMLTGSKKYVDVLFPNGDFSLARNFYQGGPIHYLNSMIGMATLDVIKQKIEDNPYAKIQILEIGAGTGSTSAIVLDIIKEYGDNITYWYTDIGGGFTRLGRREYGVKYSFMDFKVFNVAKDPSEQNIEPYSIDIVIATNVIHATNNIQHSIHNIARLCKPQGVVLLSELSRRRDFTTVSFALTKEWWQYDDANLRIPYSPILLNTTWLKLFGEAGFKEAAIWGIPELSNDEQDQNVIFAKKF